MRRSAFTVMLDSQERAAIKALALALGGITQGEAWRRLLRAATSPHDGDGAKAPTAPIAPTAPQINQS